MENIIQLIPANGWYLVESPLDDESPPQVTPIICWALIEGDDGRREVVGMDTAGVEIAECVGDHSSSHYIHESEFLENKTKLEEYAQKEIYPKTKPKRR